MKLDILLLAFLVLTVFSTAEVSEASFRTFWEVTYDLDGDGKASL